MLTGYPISVGCGRWAVIGRKHDPKIKRVLEDDRGHHVNAHLGFHCRVESEVWTQSVYSWYIEARDAVFEQFNGICCYEALPNI